MMNDRVKKLLTQKQKERLCYLHWNLGTMAEDDFYLELLSKNKELNKIYDETVKEAIEELNFNYDDYLKGDIDFWLDDYDYDEFLLLLMQKLDEKLEVGLYDYN